MKKRKLGHSPLEIAPLVFGGNVFGWTVDEKMSFELLDAFVDAGFNMIDTADIYSNWVEGNGGGVSEMIIGDWMRAKKNRHDIVIATKVGMEMGPGKKGLSRAYIFKAVEDSLRRLKTDYIDLYFAHEEDPNTSINETLGAFAELIQQGKVRVIGASNFSAKRLIESLDTQRYPTYQCLQPQYNLMERKEYEEVQEPISVKYGIGVITYFSLASGFLTGKYRSLADCKKGRGEMVKKYLDEKGLNVLHALDEVAKRINANPAQVALAWIMARPSVTAPIASATSVKQLRDLMKAADLKLSFPDIDLLNKSLL